VRQVHPPHTPKCLQASLSGRQVNLSSSVNMT